MDYLQKIIPVTALFLIILFILILIVRRLSYRRTSHCKCPACGQEFKPSLMQLIFSVGGKGGQILFCPNCGEKNYLERIPDEEDSSGDNKDSPKIIAIPVEMIRILEKLKAILAGMRRRKKKSFG